MGNLRSVVVELFALFAPFFGFLNELLATGSTQSHDQHKAQPTLDLVVVSCDFVDHMVLAAAKLKSALYPRLSRPDISANRIRTFAVRNTNEVPICWTGHSLANTIWPIWPSS